MSNVATEVVVILALLVLNGLLAMAEIAIVSARKARLRQQADSGDAGAAAALELAEDPNRFLSTVQIGITLVGILAGAFGGATIAASMSVALESIPPVAPFAETIALVVVVGAITFLSLIVGELVPKRLALNAPEQIAAVVARPMRALARFSTPVVVLLSATTDAVLRVLGVHPSRGAGVSQEEVRILIAEGTQAGVFEQAERELVESTFELSETQVRELMTPRPLVEWIDVEKDPPEAQWNALAQLAHLHIPLCRGQLDEVVGIVAVRELVSDLVTGQRPDLSARAHPPLFLPEKLSAFRALEHFRHYQPHIGLVVDEHGSISGVITPTDILQALVGGLGPLAGEPRSGPVQRPDGSWLLDGLMPLTEVAEVLNISGYEDRERGPVQTLGGLIMAELGRIPLTADRLTWRGVEFEVLDMDGRRVDKVLATRIADGATHCA
jgi:magnesium and cobalt exporter, CNNM family